MEKKDRLTRAFGHLVYLGKVKTKQDVANTMGSPSTNIISAFNGNMRYLTDNFLRRFNMAFDGIFNDSWLIDGTGDMLKGDNNSINYDITKEQSIPFFGESEIVTAGILSGFGNALMAQDITNVITLPMLNKKEGDFAMQVRGRSMIDTVHPDQNINDGAIVVLRPWRESFIEWGEIYCIATRNGFVVKRLMPSDSDEKIVCVSSNDAEYKPFDVYKSDITDIAKVKAIINLQIL